jgi:CheY-like chemotaxis protein/two-component sensor histidine kinase
VQAPPPAPVAEPAAESLFLRELELNASRDAAERTSRAKSRLLAEIAHELRTPLQGAVELLTEPTGPTAPLDARALRDTLRHLSTLVDDLADMGALEAGGVALARTRTDPRKVVDQVCAMHAVQAGPRPIRLAEGDTSPLIGDEVRLRQIVSNLLSNALKHGRGTVTVATQVTRGERDGVLTIEVSDEGPPLSDQALATIFEPFRRGSDAAETEGLGLGLPIARRLARAMGGDLLPRMRDGRMAFVLEVRLPLADPVSTNSAGSPGRRVLVVEDVDLSRRVLTRLLTAEGCEVQQARDAEEALQMWSEGSFDLVLTDQRMPGLTGAALCRRLRGRGFSGPIALAAGVDDADLRAEVADLLDVVVLRKPVDRAMLRIWLDSGPAGAPSRPQVTRARVAELVEALGPAADAIFAELPGEVEALLVDLETALRAGVADEAGAAAHRLAGLAEHFGLAELAEECRRLEHLAAHRPIGVALADGDTQRALRTAVGRIDWLAFEAPTTATMRDPCNF